MTARMTAGEALLNVECSDPSELSATPFAKMWPSARQDYEDRATRILSDAAAIRARMGEGWQPIETAPLDTNVLLGWWETWPERIWKTEAEWAGASNTKPPGMSNGWRHGHATHWQPIPEPPK